MCREKWAKEWEWNERNNIWTIERERGWGMKDTRNLILISRDILSMILLLLPVLSSSSSSFVSTFPIKSSTSLTLSLSPSSDHPSLQSHVHFNVRVTVITSCCFQHVFLPLSSCLCSTLHVHASTWISITNLSLSTSSIHFSNHIFEKDIEDEGEDREFIIRRSNNEFWFL